MIFLETGVMGNTNWKKKIFHVSKNINIFFYNSSVSKHCRPNLTGRGIRFHVHSRAKLL